MERAIDASTTVGAPLARCGELVLADPASVFADGRTADGRLAVLDLDVDLGAGASVRQCVTVDLGTPWRCEAAVGVPLRWTASGRERLFPRFAGRLLLSADGDDTRLTLEGGYIVPLGAIGRFGDGLLGRRLVRRSLAALVERIAGRLTAAVSGVAAPTGTVPAYPVDLTETGPSELHIG